MKLLKRLCAVTTVWNALAIIAVVHNVNAVCMWLAYQPEVPESAKKLILPGASRDSCPSGGRARV